MRMEKWRGRCINRSSLDSFVKDRLRDYLFMRERSLAREGKRLLAFSYRVCKYSMRGILFGAPGW
jgi:hypothetical protein